MKNSKMSTQGKMIVALIFIVVVLLGVILYSFALRPSFNGYVVSKQVEAQDFLIVAMVNQLQQNGYVQIPVGEEVLTLIPYQSPEEQQDIIE